MKNLITTFGSAFILLMASSCGGGSTAPDKVDSLSGNDTNPSKDTVYPKSDAGSLRKDTTTVQPGAPK